MRIGAIAGATAALMTIALTNEPGIRDVSIKKRRKRDEVEVRPVYSKSAKLNRSRHWPHAESYAAARAMSPFPNRPVR